MLASSLSGISLLVIPMVTRGVIREKIENSGNSCEGSSCVRLEDVHVPVETLIGAANNGFHISITNYNKERFMIAVDCNRQA